MAHGLAICESKNHSISEPNRLFYKSVSLFQNMRGKNRVATSYVLIILLRLKGKGFSGCQTVGKSLMAKFSSEKRE